MGKNIQKVQDMVAGNFKHKTQVGYTPTREEHKVGDKWKDSDDVEWEQKIAKAKVIEEKASLVDKSNF